MNLEDHTYKKPSSLRALMKQLAWKFKGAFCRRINPELLNLTNRHSVDCLTWAVNECSRNLLLDFGASPATLNKLNSNILHFPLREQRFRIAALLLSDIIRRYDRAMAQSLLRGQNDNGETPIHFWVHRDPQNNEAMDARDSRMRPY